MLLYKIPNLSLGHLRAKFVRTAKKAAGPRHHDSVGRITVTSLLETEKFEEKEESTQLPLPSAAKESTPESTKAVVASTITVNPAHTEATIRLEELEGSSTESEARSQIGMTPLERPWFSRRRSSLMRISAADLQITDDVRSPKPQANRRQEFGPPTHDDVSLTSEGIEMEMEDFVKGSSERSDNADDGASVFTIERVSFLVAHRANPLRFAPTTSKDATDPVASTPTTETTIGLDKVKSSERKLPSSRIPRPKPRPAPLPIFSTETARLTQPFPVQDCFCVISDSPLSFWSTAETCPNTPGNRTTILLWPSTARSSVSLIRPGTAESSRSEYQSGWW